MNREMRTQVESIEARSRTHAILYPSTALEDFTDELGSLSEDLDLILDVTSLTKPLIYETCSNLLRRRRSLWIAYTEAAYYDPTQEVLRQIANLLELGEYSAMEELNLRVTGEMGPFTTRTLGHPLRDPVQPTLLAAPVPLKHTRLGQVLADVGSEYFAAIVPVDSDGPESPRSVVTKAVAEYYLREFSGDTYHAPAINVSDVIHASAGPSLGIFFDSRV